MNYKLNFLVIFLILSGFMSSDANRQHRTVKLRAVKDSVWVYSTAKDTDMRLSLVSKLTFQPAIQPLETEVSIFVNPNKTFQTFFGIGGAITDASAEVFASLSSPKQEELLKAYYSPESGIGY